MCDESLIDRIDFLQDRGYGRGGFRIGLPPRYKYYFYDDQTVVSDLSGHYLNPLGPFKKEVSIYIEVVRKYKLFHLSYKTEFWNFCDQTEFIDVHLRPFLGLFRRYVNNNIDSSKLHGGEYRFLSKSEFPDYSAGTTEEVDIKEVDMLFDFANYYKK